MLVKSIMRRMELIMKSTYKNIFNLLVVSSVLALVGCSERPVKIIKQPVFIKPKYPKLRMFDAPEKLHLHLRNSGKVVIIKKEEFKSILNYITTLKKQNLKYKSEIEMYNEFTSSEQEYN